MGSAPQPKIVHPPPLTTPSEESIKKSKRAKKSGTGKEGKGTESALPPLTDFHEAPLKGALRGVPECVPSPVTAPDSPPSKSVPGSKNRIVTKLLDPTANEQKSHSQLNAAKPHERFGAPQSTSKRERSPVELGRGHDRNAAPARGPPLPSPSHPPIPSKGPLFTPLALPPAMLHKVPPPKDGPDPSDPSGFRVLPVNLVGSMEVTRVHTFAWSFTTDVTLAMACGKSMMMVVTRSDSFEYFLHVLDERNAHLTLCLGTDPPIALDLIPSPSSFHSAEGGTIALARRHCVLVFARPGPTPDSAMRRAVVENPLLFPSSTRVHPGGLRWLRSEAVEATLAVVASGVLLVYIISETKHKGFALYPILRVALSLPPLSASSLPEEAKDPVLLVASLTQHTVAIARGNAVQVRSSKNDKADSAKSVIYLDPVAALSVSADGSTFFVGLASGEVHHLNAASGVPLPTVGNSRLCLERGAFHRIDMCPVPSLRDASMPPALLCRADVQIAGVVVEVLEEPHDPMKVNTFVAGAVDYQRAFTVFVGKREVCCVALMS